ncbi:ion transport protein [Fragilaria crotonensis]|nr:ion transport protein [Fragilaria crotonensis]
MSLSADEAPYEKQTDLFRQIGCKDWTKALATLHSKPHEARLWISTKYRGGVLAENEDDITVWYRRLPLHHACSAKGVPVSFIQALIDAYPDALLLEDETGKVPLIHACRRGTSLEVVKAVLTEETAKRPDKEGKCALHWACEYKADKSMIKMLVEAAPSILEHCDKYGRLPLHWGCVNVSERSDIMPVVAYLLEQYPVAVSVQDSDCRAPRHMIDIANVLELLLKTEESLPGIAEA